ncbi:hypothetical protein [Desulfonatronum lacustre]|uniref:hypothetical protein n=1 Tax=Desulfonatronum lacustre TaxID=66849 RepID=UPI0004B8DD38|nr:hypothetical protein [Desulfonatronum lacustre]
MERDEYGGEAGGAVAHNFIVEIPSNREGFLSFSAQGVQNLVPLIPARGAALFTAKERTCETVNINIKHIKVPVIRQRRFFHHRKQLRSIN